MKEKIQNIMQKFLTKEVIMYIIFGVLTTLVNLVISFSLVEAFNVDGSIASAIGIITSILFAYFTNRKWVFNTQAKGIKENFNEFWKFIAGRAVTMIIEQGGVMIFYGALGMPFAPVKLSLTIIVIILNYIFSKFFAFKNKKEGENEKQLTKMKDKISIKEVIEKNKLNIFILLGMLTFTFIICFNFLKPHFSNDAYYVTSYGYDYYINHFLASNRIFSALILKIFLILDIPFVKELSIMGIILTFVMAISWFILYKFVIKLINKESSIIHNILIGSAAFLVVFNICTAEGLLFIEVGTMPFGILFAILGACILATDKKFKYIISLILVTISGLFYQVTSSIFVLLALVLIAIKNKGNIKLIIKDTIIIGLIYGFAMIVNFVGVKIWDNVLDNEFRKFTFPSISVIIDTILKFGEFILIYNSGIGPKYWYLITLIIISIIFIIDKVIKKKDYFEILEYVTLIVLSILIPIIPILATPVESQYMEPRMAMCFGAIIGILVIFLLSVVRVDKNKISLTIVGLIAVLNFIGNSIFLVEASTSTLITNQMDKIIAEQIIDEIKEYEKTTGKEITSIGVAFDKNYTMYYSGQPALRCFDVRSLGTGWAVKEVIITYTGKYYENVNVPEEIQKEFLNKDWNTYDKEQLVFDGNNLYICIF